MNTHNDQQKSSQLFQDAQMQSQAVQSQKPEEPQNPISGSHKELGPIREAPVAEYVAPSSPHETEPVLAPEVKEAGVESVPSQEMPKLTEEHKKTGMAHAPEATPVSTTSSMAIQLPYTYPQVQQKVKDTPVEESAHWLAVLHKFILERLGAKV